MILLESIQSKLSSYFWQHETLIPLMQLTLVFEMYILGRHNQNYINLNIYKLISVSASTSDKLMKEGTKVQMNKGWKV